MKSEHLSASAKAIGPAQAAKTSPQGAESKWTGRSQPPSKPVSSTGRRATIVLGSASFFTLGAWGLLSASLPSHSQPKAIEVVKPAAQTPTAAGGPTGAAQKLLPMSDAEFAAFKPTLKPGFGNTNQDASSACPEAIGRMMLIPTSVSQGRLRVISGAYTSAWFQLAKGPLAFVIPFPAPYATGQGVLVIEGDAEHGVLSLVPGLELSLSSSTRLSIPVYWDVNSQCR